MQKITIRPVWNRKGNNLIELELYRGGGERRRISTGIRSAAWDGESQRIPDDPETNRALRAQIDKLREIIDYQGDADLGTILSAFRGEPEERKARRDLMGWLWDEIAKAPVRESTRRHHLVTWEALRRFGRLRRFDDLTAPALARFDEWLRYDDPNLRKSPKGRALVTSRTQATIHTYHKCLKVHVSKAYRLGLIDSNPYDRFEDRRGDERTAIALTREELSRIELLDLRYNTVLDRSRDYFLIMAYTGMAFSDVANFRSECIVERGGRRFISASRHKTGVDFIAPLPDPALRIMAKYGDQMPFEHNAKLNERLKVLAVMAGIRKHLTSHVARHTFITLSLEAGIPLKVVQRMAGHSSVTMTERYEHLGDSYVMDGAEALF